MFHLFRKKDPPQYNNDFEKLNFAIENLTKALIDVKEVSERDETSKRIAKSTWKASLGLRDDLSGLKKCWNEFVCFVKLLTFPKKYQNKNEVLGTRFLMAAFLSVVFWGAELLCLFFTGYQIRLIIYKKEYVTLLSAVPISLLLLFISRFFRMARYEIEDMSNKESLYLVFTAVVSFLAMIFTIVSPK